jgi:hypothetical protein
MTMEDLDNFVPKMYFKPEDDKGDACLSIEMNGQKRYRRIWIRPNGDIYAEWGWSLADTAIELKGAR